MAPTPLAPLSATMLVAAFLISVAPAPVSSWALALKTGSTAEAQAQPAPRPAKSKPRATLQFRTSSFQEAEPWVESRDDFSTTQSIWIRLPYYLTTRPTCGEEFA